QLDESSHVNIWDKARLYAPQVTHFLDTLDKKTGDQALLANLLGRIGTYNQVVEVNYQEALRYYDQSLEMLKALDDGNHRAIANSLNNIGSVYHNLGQNEKALRYYDQSLE